MRAVDERALHLPRLIQVLAAIRASREAAFVGAFVANGEPSCEAIVIDLTCGEVPSRNPVGVRRTERLAIFAPEGAERPPTVLALRKGFPKTMHVNATPVGTPRSLCLYFEPHRAVMRSWTGANFLRRIQWWLVNTANGALHAVDQPLEQPFFDSGWELIIPPNLLELQRRPDVKFVVTRQGHRTDDRVTLSLQVLPPGAAANHEFGLAVVDVPPAKHFQRTNMPASLGELEEEMRARGSNLQDALKSALESLPVAGLPRVGSSDRFVLLVNFPVTRQEGDVAEEVQRIALVALEGRLGLGLKLGAYFEHEGRVYNQATVLGNPPQDGDWRAIQTAPAAVLFAPNSAAFREYSGTANVGPLNGTIVGVGSLGSELLNLFLRSGWGEWSVVDGDHLKPHNLARHQGYARHLGLPKVEVSDLLATEIFGEKKLKTILAVDACDQSNEPLRQVLDESDLIVDCSTTLDFPRLASRSERRGRHVSLFLTPSGNGSVLLAEDRGRNTRLRSLESQYYRAVIEHPWGTRHLTSHLGKYWSGASCRDISSKLPLSAVVAHAAVLAERLARIAEQDEASMAVWDRDPVTGAVSPHSVQLMPPCDWKSAHLTVFSDEGLVAKLRRMRAESLPRETGGILVGYHDLNLNEIHIVDALPPPPDSHHSEGHFIRGVAGLSEQHSEIQNRTANVVGYVGEWHSHPPGHSSRQSPDDLVQVMKLTLGMAEDGLPFVQLIVGEHDVAVYTGGLLEDARL